MMQACNGAPDDQGVALWNPDGVLVHKVIELGRDRAEVEHSQALAHAVCPDLLQGRHDGRHICALVQETLHAHRMSGLAWPYGDMSGSIAGHSLALIFLYGWTSSRVFSLFPGTRALGRQAENNAKSEGMQQGHLPSLDLSRLPLRKIFRPPRCRHCRLADVCCIRRAESATAPGHCWTELTGN